LQIQDLETLEPYLVTRKTPEVQFAEEAAASGGEESE